MNLTKVDKYEGRKMPEDISRKLEEELNLIKTSLKHEGDRMLAISRRGDNELVLDQIKSKLTKWYQRVQYLQDSELERAFARGCSVGDRNGGPSKRTK